MINLILMVDKNWGYRKNNKPIYNISKHTKLVEELIKDNIVVYGFHYFVDREFEIYPNCKNYVISPEYVKSKDNLVAVHSLSELLSCLSKEDKDIFVLGGIQTLKSIMPYVSKIYLTKINEDVGADEFIMDVGATIKMDYYEVSKSEDFTYRNHKYNLFVYENYERKLI